MKEKKTLDLPSLSDEAMRKIASDIADGAIFCDRQLGKNTNLLPSVFLPIALGAFSGYNEEELKKVGMVYEYMYKAGPRSINGFPTFMSMIVVSHPDTDKIFEYYDKYKKVKEEFLTKTA